MEYNQTDEFDEDVNYTCMSSVIIIYVIVFIVSYTAF